MRVARELKSQASGDVYGKRTENPSDGQQGGRPTDWPLVASTKLLDFS
jgi:hypothetical protein